MRLSYCVFCCDHFRARCVNSCAQLSIVPLGRAGRPKDIANAVCFFADPENDYTTGTCLVVDGGMRAGL